MGGGSGGFEAAALIDADINDYGAWFHELEVFGGHQPGGSGAGNQNATNDEVGAAELFADVVSVTEECVDVGGHDVIEVAEAFEVDIEDDDIGLEAGGDASCILPDNASTKNRNMGRLNAGDAAEKNSATFLGAFEEFCSLLNAHPPCHFAHGSEQRQIVAGAAKGFVGNSGDSGFEQVVGELFVCGEVEVGKDDLFRPEEWPFAGERFLDFDDQIGGSKDLGMGIHECSAAGGIIVIRDAAPETSAAFDEHAMSVADKFFDAAGEHGDAVFIGFDFFGETDVHGD
jgi:hypothetical protein